MTTTTQKQEILSSIASLDSAQTEQVLRFIRGLADGRQTRLRYLQLKRQAMMEIGQALGQQERH